MADISVPKIPIHYECKICDYISSSKKDYSKHIMTRKHKNTYIGLTNADKISQKSQQLWYMSLLSKTKSSRIYLYSKANRWWNKLRAALDTVHYSATHVRWKNGVLEVEGFGDTLRNSVDRRLKNKHICCDCCEILSW